MPTALRLFGNRVLAALYWGEGRRLLFQLKQILSLGNVPQGSMLREYPDGTTIRVKQVFEKDFIIIESPFLGGEREREIQDLFVFLFFTEGDFKVYRIAIDQDGYGLAEKKPKQFPFPHVWYSSTWDEKHNVLPVALANASNRKHYINTALDPILSPARNAYDDWNLQSGLFSPSGWAWDEMIRESPTVFPALMKSHFSISPYTHFSGVAFTLGGIVQPYRQSAPEVSLVPLWDGEKIVETEIVNNGPGAYGPRGYTLGDKGYANSWKERVYASGSTAPSVTQNLGVPEIWLGYFFFPWIPYLHEISGFPILGWAEGLGAITVSPGPINPQVYSLRYLDGTGSKVETHLADSAAYVFSQGNHTTQTVPSFDTIFRIVYGGHGGWSPAGLWPDFQFGGGVGAFAYELVTTTMDSKSASATGRYYSPVGAIGRKKTLVIKNEFNLSVSWALSNTSSFAKSTAMPWQYYLLWSGVEEFWMPNGDYPVTDTASFADTTHESRNLSLTQQLLFGDELIDEGVGALTYSYSLNRNGSGGFGWTFHNQSTLPLFLDGYYTNLPGEATVNEYIVARAGRNIVAFEVLAFDSMQLSDKTLAMAIYKKITIEHSQTNSIHKSASSAPQGPSRSATGFPFPGLPSSGTESFSVTGVRKAEYYLWCRIGDTVLPKAKLAEFNSAVTNASGALVHSGSGERLWGVSCQLNRDLIVYHYQKEAYLGNGTAPGYDSPMNFEDISYQGETKLWAPGTIVVGVINAGQEEARKAGLSHKRFEFDPPEAEAIYSVGLHRKEKEITREAEVA